MKYRKKPVVIEAIQYTKGMQVSDFPWFADELDMGSDENNLSIYTLEGIMQAKNGDYIIKGVRGEFYPCKPDIFEETYEKVED